MSRAKLLEIVRYLLTGGLSVALNLAVVVFFTEFVGLNYLLSITICFASVTFVSFLLNRSWTFGKGRLSALRELLRYFSVQITQLPISLLACAFCVQILHLSYPLAMVLVSALFVPTTYLIHRRWSFGLKWSEQTQTAEDLVASANNCPPRPNDRKSSALRT
jgi:putative flippase GtrA